MCNDAGMHEKRFVVLDNFASIGVKCNKIFTQFMLNLLRVAPSISVKHAFAALNIKNRVTEKLDNSLRLQ
jgi:hypothetical protein